MSTNSALAPGQTHLTFYKKKLTKTEAYVANEIIELLAIAHILPRGFLKENRLSVPRRNGATCTWGWLGFH